MKVSELEGPLLDYWVAVCLGHKARIVGGCEIIDWNRPGTKVNGCRFEPTTDWRHGGPIIFEDQIYLEPPHTVHRANYDEKSGRVKGVWETYESWHATVSSRTRTYPNPNFEQPELFPGCVGRGEGPHPLIAAMRAKVCSHYGPEVPDDF
jgi:Protein of unknown function (DUF2591)